MAPLLAPAAEVATVISPDDPPAANASPVFIVIEPAPPVAPELPLKILTEPLIPDTESPAFIFIVPPCSNALAPT